MSINDKPTEPENTSNGRSIVVGQAGSIEPADSQWVQVPEFAPASAGGGQNLMLVLHALRRHAAMAIGLGVVLAAVLVTLVWFGYGTKYSASRYFRVKMTKPIRVFTTADAVRDPRIEFDIYRDTQKSLVTNPFVLNAALREPKAASLPSVKQQEDPIGWLSKRIHVDFLGDSEIMQIGMTGNDPNEVQILLDAIVKSYTENVADAERRERLARLSELETVYSSKEVVLRRKLTEQRKLAEQSGTGDPKQLDLKHQVVLEDYGNYRKAYLAATIAEMQAAANVTALKGMLNRLGEEQLSDYELYAYAIEDPVYKRLMEQMGWAQSDVKYTESISRGGANSSHTSRQMRNLDIVQAQLDERLYQMREEVRARKRAELETEIQKWESELQTRGKEKSTLEALVEERKQEAEKIGGHHLDLEMLTTEITQLDGVLKEIANERSKLQVEVDAAARTEHLKADMDPQAHEMVRYMLSILAALVGLVLPGACVALWDLRSRRINSTEEVVRDVGLSIMGTLPAIPARALRQLGSSQGRNQMWQMRLTESIDGIGARLLRKAEIEDTRVVLVTSATEGEGKTTISTQLAMSLARSGRRTLLIDFDLRRPALNEVFGQALEPGVSEVLRKQHEVPSVVHPTAVPNLSILTAGRWDRLALAALANGVVGPMFDELREDYEFIIIDSAPVLPVADTRIVSQHVDAVIISVFRDVSQVPRVNETCEILQAFGVKNIEAVVTGQSEGGRGKYLTYESTVEMADSVA